LGFDIVDVDGIKAQFLKGPKIYNTARRVRRLYRRYGTEAATAMICY